MRQYIRDHRRTPAARFIASCAEKYLRAWYNEDFYSFESNGELYVLSAIAEWRRNRPTVIWDVGAHTGSWALAAHDQLPNAEVVGFEIAPANSRRLASLTDSNPWLTVHDFGLSDQSGEVALVYNRDHDSTNSISPRLDSGLFAGQLETIVCQVRRADEVIATTRKSPTFVKIDVEGHEVAVLRGFGGIFAKPCAPAAIQFEYGETYLPGGFTLKQAYSLLEPFGYILGRMYPNHVEFKQYELSDDHFRMGNYLAVRDEHLIAELRNRSR